MRSKDADPALRSQASLKEGNRISDRLAGERVNDDDGGIVILHLFGKAESGLDRHRSGRSLSRQKLAYVAVGGRLKRDCGCACLQRLTMSSRRSISDRRHQQA
jgi:hypothetical protein